MPGPVLKFKPIDAPNVASKLPEILQKPAGTILQGILDLIGADDPMSGAYPAAFGITRFKNFDTLRERGLENVRRFKDQMDEGVGLGPLAKLTKKIFGPSASDNELVTAVSLAQERWPRLFGHLNSVDVDPNIMKLFNKNQLNMGGYFPRRDRTGNLQLNRSVIKQARGYGEDPATTVGHELLHAADSLAIPDASASYAFSNKLPGGYNTNQMEVRARNMGDRYKQILDAIFEDAIRTGELKPKLRVPHTEFTKGTSKID